MATKIENEKPDIDKYISNLDEIISLCKEEINEGDICVTAILDYQDLVSLKHVIDFAKECRKMFDGFSAADWYELKKRKENKGEV